MIMDHFKNQIMLKINIRIISFPIFNDKCFSILLQRSYIFTNTFEVLLGSFKDSPKCLGHLGDISSIHILMINRKIAIHNLSNFDLIVLHNRCLDCLIDRCNKRTTHIIYIQRYILANGPVMSSNPSDPTEVIQAAPT